jgi:hypothetical protein
VQNVASPGDGLCVRLKGNRFTGFEEIRYEGLTLKVM